MWMLQFPLCPNTCRSGQMEAFQKTNCNTCKVFKKLLCISSKGLIANITTRYVSLVEGQTYCLKVASPSLQTATEVSVLGRRVDFTLWLILNAQPPTPARNRKCGCAEQLVCTYWSKRECMLSKHCLYKYKKKKSKVSVTYLLLTYLGGHLFLIASEPCYTAHRLLVSVFLFHSFPLNQNTQTQVVSVQQHFNGATAGSRL